MDLHVLTRLDVIALLVIAFGGMLSLMAFSREWQEKPDAKVRIRVKVGRYIAATGAGIVVLGSSLAIAPLVFTKDNNSGFWIYIVLASLMAACGIGFLVLHRQISPSVDADDAQAQKTNSPSPAEMGAAVQIAVADQLKQMQAVCPGPRTVVVYRRKESVSGVFMSGLVIGGILRIVTRKR